MPADGPALLRRRDQLRQHAAAHFALCERMAPYLAPSRVGVLGPRAPGASQVAAVYDSTSMMAAELMAMFLAGYLINPGQLWGSMTMRQAAVAPRDDVREWLDECRDRMLSAFKASLFYAEGPESMIDWGGFGTGFLLVEEAQPSPLSPRRGFRGLYTEALKTGRFVVADGPNGLVDTVFFDYHTTVRAAVRRFGDRQLPDKWRQALAAGRPDEPVTLVRAITPRGPGETAGAAGNRGMPFLSCWIDEESRLVVHESGYRRFPGAVYRYHRTPGETMGRGRGQLVFPDTWTLNTAKEMGLEDWALKLRPPLFMRHDAVLGTLRIKPAAPTAINTHGAAIRDAIMPYETGSNPQVSHIKEEALRQSIRQIFFVDQILALMQVSKSEMTAFEFAKKLELLFRIVGPVYGRAEQEFLRPVWDTVFDLMLDAGALPPPPPIVYDTDGYIDVAFENPIARAQRAGDIEAVTQSLADLAPFAQADPRVLDWFDPDATAQYTFLVRGVPARVTRSREEVQALREARLAQHQEQQQAAWLAGAADAAGKVAPLVAALEGPRP